MCATSSNIQMLKLFEGCHNVDPCLLPWRRASSSTDNRMPCQFANETIVFNVCSHAQSIYYSNQQPSPNRRRQKSKTIHIINRGSWEGRTHVRLLHKFRFNTRHQSHQNQTQTINDVRFLLSSRKYRNQDSVVEVTRWGYFKDSLWTSDVSNILTQATKSLMTSPCHQQVASLCRQSQQGRYPSPLLQWHSFVFPLPLPGVLVSLAALHT